MAWRWQYDGSAAESASVEFPAQADAEAWLGDHWRELQDSGVTAVTLTEGDRVVYGPMSLDPA